MHFAQLQQFQQRQEQRCHLFPGGRVGKGLVKAHAAPAADAVHQRQHAFLHGMLVPADVPGRVVVDLLALVQAGSPGPDAQERVRQPLQRQAHQLRLLGRQGVFLRQLGEQLLGRPLKLLHGRRRLPEALVFLQAADQRLLRILLALLQGGRLGQHGAALDLHERGRHDEKIRRIVHIQVGGVADGGNVLVGDLADENVPDIHLRLGDQVQEQVKGAVKVLQLKRHWHGSTLTARPRSAGTG